MLLAITPVPILALWIFPPVTSGLPKNELIHFDLHSLALIYLSLSRHSIWLTELTSGLSVLYFVMVLSHIILLTAREERSIDGPEALVTGYNRADSFGQFTEVINLWVRSGISNTNVMLSCSNSLQHRQCQRRCNFLVVSGSVSGSYSFASRSRFF